MIIILNIIVLVVLSIVAVIYARHSYNRGISVGREQVLKEDMMRLDIERQSVKNDLVKAIKSIQPCE